MANSPDNDKAIDALTKKTDVEDTQGNNVLCASTFEESKEKMLELSNKRRRKQQKPQRCNSMSPPHALSDIDASTLEDPVTDYAETGHVHKTESLSSTHVENVNEPIMKVPRIETQRSLQSKPQSIKPGNYFKFLHRPYYLKGAKGFFRSQPHQCADCGKKFALRDSLKKHISRIHTIKIHQCSFCGKQYRLADSLRKHIKRDHSGEMHHCARCDKYFTSKESLTQHWRIHTGEKPFSCPQCNAAFRYRHHLKQHIRTHNGIIESCEICGKQYNRRDSLKKHIRKVHNKGDSGNYDPNSDLPENEEEKLLHTRQEISKYHMVSPALLQHMTNSSENKVRNLLNRAMITNMLYFCRKCHLQFTCRQSLLRHMQSRHRKVILVCPICNQQYHLRDSLRKHVKSAHRMKLKDNRNTKAEIESRRSIHKPKIEIADVECDGAKNSINASESECKTGGYKESDLTNSKDNEDAIAKPSKCPYCIRCYRLKDSLRKHIKRSHPGACKETKTVTEFNQNTVKSELKVTEYRKPKKESEEKASQLKVRTESQSHTESFREVITPNEDKKPKVTSDVIDLNNFSKMYEERSQLRYQYTQTRAADIIMKDCAGIVKRNDGLQEMVNKEQTESVESNLDNTDALDLFPGNSCNPQLTIKQEHQINNTNKTHRRVVGGDSDDIYGQNMFHEEDSKSIDQLNQQQADLICMTCSLTFGSQQDLNNHVQTHPTCISCNRKCTNVDSLLNHIKCSHLVVYRKMIARKQNSQQDFVFTCGNESIDVVSEVPKDKKLLKPQDDLNEKHIHLESCKYERSNDLPPHKLGVLACITTSCDNQDDVDSHVQTYHNCPCCDRQYTLKDSLRKHIRRSHPAEYQEIMSRKQSSHQDIVNSFARNSIDVASDISKEDDPNGQQIYQGSSEYERQKEDQVSQQPGVFICTTCTLTFDCQQDLDIHVQKHPTCPQCNKQYSLRDSLRKHIRRSHPETYKEMKAYKEHSTAGRAQVSFDTICTNSANASESQPFLCNQESAFYPNASVDTSSGTDHEQYEEISHESNPTQEILDATINDEPESFTCPICNLTFDSQHYLSIHVDIHPTCPYCYKQYCLRDSLRKHIKRSHGDETECRPTQIIVEKAYTGNLLFCSVCGQNFVNQSDLHTHEQGHPSCPCCDKVLSSRASLRRHIQHEHSGVRTEQSTREENEVKELVLNETKESEKSGELDTFDEFAQSVSHEMERSTVAGYDRADCKSGRTDGASDIVLRGKPGPKDDNDVGTLPDTEAYVPQKQLKIAIDDNSVTSSESSVRSIFPCPACLLIFDNQDALDRHARNHFACPYCGKLYSIKDSLKKHIKRSHPTEYNTAITSNHLNKNIEYDTRDNTTIITSDRKNNVVTDADELSKSALNNGNNRKQDKIFNEATQYTKHHCLVCFLVFDSKKALENHTINHPACPYCDKMYRLKDSLQKHIKRSHPYEQKITRANSGQSENSNDANYSTTTSDHIDAEYPEVTTVSLTRNKQDIGDQASLSDVTPSEKACLCPACMLVFDNQEALDCHVKTHPACPYCDKRYKLMPSLQKHIQRSHPVEHEKRRSSKLPLEEVGWVKQEPRKISKDPSDSADNYSVDKSATAEHNREHDIVNNPDTVSSVKPVGIVYPCPACTLIFDSKDALVIHANTHSSCPYCGRLYTLKNSLQRHMQRSHPVEYREQKVSNSSFVNADGVGVHIYDGDTTGFENFEEPTAPYLDDISKSKNKWLSESTNMNEYAGQFRLSGEEILNETSTLDTQGIKVIGGIGETCTKTLLNCATCDLTFYSQEELNKHNEYLSCPHCDRHYSIRNSLQKHIQRSHSDAQQEH